MYLRLSAIAAACGILLLSGCGSDGDGIDDQPIFTSQIYSDPVFDGDIEQVSPNVYTVTQGMSSSVQSVLVGVDPVGGTEFRAFLDFPLGGAGRRARQCDHRLRVPRDLHRQSRSSERSTAAAGGSRRVSTAGADRHGLQSFKNNQPSHPSF